MPRDADRTRRLNARRKAQRAIERLRELIVVLAEIERVEDADAIGVVRIEPGDSEGDYAADVLDVVGQAAREAGRGRVVEVLVISTPEQANHHRAESPPIGGGPCQDRTERAPASTPTSEPSTARAAPS